MSNILRTKRVFHMKTKLFFIIIKELLKLAQTQEWPFKCMMFKVNKVSIYSLIGAAVRNNT